MLNGNNRLHLKKLSINLRLKGFSYSVIQNKIGVSKSTLSGWLHDIPYEPNKVILKRIKYATIRSRKSRLIKKNLELFNIRKSVEENFGKITKRDLFMLGLGLYMGEGSKNKSGTIRITNSDPKIIKLSLKWFIKIFNVHKNNIFVYLHLYPDSDIENILQFWIKYTKISKENFGKVFIDRRLGKLSRSKRRLKYGTATLTVRAQGNKDYGVLLFRKIINYIEAANRKINAGMV